MNARAKEALRWSGIVGSGGFGIYLYAATLLSVFTSTERDPLPWWQRLLPLPLILLVYAPFLFVAYFVWRRNYRPLVAAFNGVGAVCVFFTVSSLIRPLLPLIEPTGDRLSNDLWRPLLCLAVAGCLLLGPFYAAGWFYRFAQRLTTRWFFPKKTPILNATP